jgi:hypothetical protein
MKALSRNLLAGALLAALPMGGALACTTGAWNGGATSATAGDPDAGIARYSGNCGLEVAASGNGHVTDNSPANETDYRARFYVFTGTASGNPVIFRATDADGAAGTALVEITYDTAANAFDFSSGSATGTAGGISDNRWYAIEFYYDAGNAITASVKGAGSDTPSAVTFSGAPAAGSINSARLGALTAATAADTMKFDEFESTRSTTTAIGFLCRGDANGDGAIGVGDAIQVGNEFAGSLASGQPDCNEDGAVGVGDAICVGNRFAATGSSCS